MAAKKLSPYLRRVVKVMREGGKLVNRDPKIGWCVLYADGRLMGTVSIATIRDLVDAEQITRKTDDEYVLVSAMEAEKKVEEVTQVFIPGTGKLQDVPEPPPVPLVIASALMARRPELLKLQQYPLSDQEQKGVVALIGDLIHEMFVKELRIKDLEAQVTKAQDRFDKAHECWMQWGAAMTDLRFVLKNKPLPEDVEDDEEE